MTTSQPPLPIEETQLARWIEQANTLLVAVTWTPKPLKAAAVASTSQFRETAATPAPEKLSLIMAAKAVSGDPILLSEETNHTLSQVRQGLRIGMHLSSLYTNASGLQTLIDMNSRGGLSEEQKNEFRAKYETASAITVFAVADYIRWSLGVYRAEEVSGTNVEFPGVIELSLLNPVRALDCAIYYYAANVQPNAGAVRSSLEFVKMTLLYWEGVIEELSMRLDSLKFVEPFTSRVYKLAGSEYTIEGFQSDGRAREESIEFNRVELHQIVGNRDAKHKARRLAERLMCYDPIAQRNPMHDLGGLQTVRMGHGEPGTGKSMQISATATLLSDFCKQLGMPFLFWPMPDTVVSTYQGGSAERMLAWMKPLRDPGKIIYAPIDDAENNLEDRTRQGVSAGVREVIAVFLRNTEGAYAIHHGNAAIELFTNLPDQLDKAVLSRIQERVYIGGARTQEDFMDQDYLWWRKYDALSAGFTGMAKPKDYEFLAHQKLVGSLSNVYDNSASSPSSEKILAIFEGIKKQFKPTEHQFFGAFYQKVKDAYPMFTSRDVRNIQQAVSTRILDFDLDPQWLENPDVFFKKDYETKKSMLTELMKSNMKGIAFPEVRLQETVRYLDSMIRITDAGRDRQLQDMMSHMELNREAQLKLAAKLQ